MYDEEFDSQIRKLTPQWFMAAANLRDEKYKKDLISRAKSGKQKPKYRTKLGKTLARLLKKDRDFRKQIEKLAPHWFTPPQAIRAAKTKKRLLKLARAGGSKPKTTTRLGQALQRYTLKGQKSYDPVFTKKIRKLRPDWFRK
jgi:hypothetical protein